MLIQYSPAPIVTVQPKIISQFNLIIIGKMWEVVTAELNRVEWPGPTFYRRLGAGTQMTISPCC